MRTKNVDEIDTFSDTYDSLFVLIVQDPTPGSKLRAP